MADEQQITSQQRFNNTYITATEIADNLGVSRVSVLRAKQRGLLPDPVRVGDGVVCIWERDRIKPNIDSWRVILQCKGKGAPA